MGTSGSFLSLRHSLSFGESSSAGVNTGSSSSSFLGNCTCDAILTGWLSVIRDGKEGKELLEVDEATAGGAGGLQAKPALDRASVMMR